MLRKLHHVTRLDYEYGGKKTRGWWVRFQRKVDGKRKTFGKAFYDATYKGKAKALAAAMKWRDENLAKYPVVRNGAGSGRLQAPIGHAIFWESKSEQQHSFNATIKMGERERPNQFRCSIREYGRKRATEIVRSWHAEMRAHLRRKGTLASDAILEAYFNRLKNARTKGRRVPW